MTLKVPFGCANCVQGPAWGQNCGQYNAVKIDIHQPEVKTSEQNYEKKLYDYPSASVYNTDAPNKALVTPPLEVTQKEKTIDNKVENDATNVKPQEKPQTEAENTVVETQEPPVEQELNEIPAENSEIETVNNNEEPLIYYAEGENGTFDNPTSSTLDESFENHNPLNHQSVNKDKLAFGANEKVKQSNKTNSSSKLPETKNNAEPVFNTQEVVKTLSSKDLKEQTIGLATIAFICEENPKIARQFLEPPIVKALTDILKQDSKKLAGPTPEQIKLRKEVMDGKKITDEQMKLASQTSPMEMSERNKQFAIYTIALLDGILINEFDKNNKTASSKAELEMRDLPGMNDVINVLKTNPNPVLRTTAVEALYYVAKPQFNPVIKPILKAATNDKDVKVKETAQKALANIDKKSQIAQKQPAQMQNQTQNIKK